MGGPGPRDLKLPELHANERPPAAGPPASTALKPRNQSPKSSSSKTGLPSGPRRGCLRRTPGVKTAAGASVPSAAGAADPYPLRRHRSVSDRGRVPAGRLRGSQRVPGPRPGSDGVLHGAVVAPAAQAVPLVQEAGGLVGGLRLLRQVGFGSAAVRGLGTTVHAGGGEAVLVLLPRDLQGESKRDGVEVASPRRPRPPPAPRSLTLTNWRSVRARTLKSATYGALALSWLLLPPTGDETESERSW